MSNTTPTAPVTYDPCAAYDRLRKAMEDLAAGKSVRGVRYRNGEEERQTDFSPADKGELRRLMLEAKAECEAKNGGTPRRQSIRFSGYRPNRFGGM